MKKHIRDLRWRCAHCGAEGWNTPGPFNIDPLHNHDRPDGRACVKAKKSRASSSRA